MPPPLFPPADPFCSSQGFRCSTQQGWRTQNPPGSAATKPRCEGNPAAMLRRRKSLTCMEKRQGKQEGRLQKPLSFPNSCKRRNLWLEFGGCAAAGWDLKDLQHAAPCRQAGAGAVQRSACSQLTLLGCRGATAE